MEKEHNSKVYILFPELSRMGPDDDDLCDLWLEKFDGHKRIFLRSLKTIPMPENVKFWANWTFDQTDYLTNDVSWDIFSPKAVGLFESLAIPMNKYPVTIVKGDMDPSKEEIYEGYFAVQFLTHIDIIDRNNSKYSNFQGSTRINTIQTLVLKEQNSYPLVFRLVDYPLVLCVSAEMKSILEKEGIKGIKFDFLED